MSEIPPALERVVVRNSGSDGGLPDALHVEVGIDRIGYIATAEA